MRFSNVLAHSASDLLVYCLQVSLLNLVCVIGVSHDQQGVEARLLSLSLQLALNPLTLFCGQALHPFPLLVALLPQALQDA